MNELILLCFCVVVLFIVFSKYFENPKESFTNLKSMNQNTNTLVKFCKRLKQFDKPSDHTLMLRNFRKRKLEKNNKIIQDLIDEINVLQKYSHMSSISQVNDYKCKLQKNAEKQIGAINKAKENILNRNTLNLQITPV